MSDEYDPDAACPGCGHRWAAHHGRRFSQACHYRQYAGHCLCKQVNPQVEAEGRFAAAAWNNFMGRTGGTE